MTQQTIGNTVYYVGQELRTMTEAGPFIDAWIEANNDNGYAEHPVSKGNNAYPVSRIHFAILPVTIEFLPNPDPVAEDWREVVLLKKFDTVTALGTAVQEVCKADEVGLKGLEDYDIPDRHIVKGRSFHQNDFEAIIRCFLLGGRVFVKGGV